jgi:hypothetical protein
MHTFRIKKNNTCTGNYQDKKSRFCGENPRLNERGDEQGISSREQRRDDGTRMK